MLKVVKMPAPNNDGYYYENKESPGARNERLRKVYDGFAKLTGKDTLLENPYTTISNHSVSGEIQIIKVDNRSTHEILKENEKLLRICKKLKLIEDN